MKNFLVALAGSLLAVGGSARGEGPVRIEWNGAFERSISAYNLFQDNRRQTPNEGLVEYGIITPLFTDYALKHRFIYLPPGHSIEYDPWETFAFPTGAALVKSFSYPVDSARPEPDRRVVETRLMILTEDGWRGAAYVWNEDHTDATLAVAGKQVPLEWMDQDGTHRRTDYLVPNVNECNACHRAAGVMEPLGITARQLNRDLPRNGAAGNQLAWWSQLGILQGLPPADDIPRVAQWDDPESGTVEQRVLAYLDINCAHCHNPSGLASYTRLDLRYSQDDAAMRGVMKRPSAAGNASRGRYFAIVPGQPDASFLLSRMLSTTAPVRMPPVGRTVSHDEGVQLVREWIQSIPDGGP